LSGSTLDGTGLSNLRERLQLAFGDAARLTLDAVPPHGTNAALVLPAQVSTP